MKITNKLFLPAPLVSAISNDPYTKVGDISVTSLAKSPRQRWLEIRHADEIEEDASARIWALLGQIGHKVLERADTDNHLHEERLTAQVLGWTVSGQPDLLDAEGTLSDYKFTSVWAAKDEKPEWTAQLNSYAWLYQRHGFEVKRARNIAILRDWSKPKASREPDYPQVGVAVREVPLWTREAQENYVYGRVSTHQFAEPIPDDGLPYCTPEERWEKPTTWAVKAPTAKRAYRVFEAAEEAGALAELKGLVVEERPGESTRCVHYCAVAPFCSQFKAMKELR